jgi:hypothetical protein
MQALSLAGKARRVEEVRLGGEHYARAPMSGNSPPQRATTPPKGRPTRPQNTTSSRKRVFGSTAQWIAVAIILVLAFVVLVIVTDGGDFNPLNGALPGGPQPGAAVGSGGDSQLM